MGGEGAAREVSGELTLRGLWKYWVQPLPFWVLRFALFRNWSIFPDFSCFSSFTYCFPSVPIKLLFVPQEPAHTAFPLEALFILLHHLHNTLNLSISWHLTHCSYLCPCLFPSQSENLWRTGRTSVSALCLQFQVLDQSVPTEVCLINWSTDWMVHSPTQSGSSGGDGIVNFITSLPICLKDSLALLPPRFHLFWRNPQRLTYSHLSSYWGLHDQIHLKAREQEWVILGSKWA